MIEATVPYTPETAQAERTTLMADAGFRERYMAGDQPTRDHMTRINAAIAAGMPDSDAIDVADAPAARNEEADDTYQPATSLAEYQFANDFAKARGLTVDLVAESHAKEALRTAGVDPSLGAVLYHAAVVGASSDPVQAQTQHFNAVNQLQQEWGSEYAANVAAVQVEAVRLFESLPASIRGEESFDDFVESRGLGSDPVLLRALLARAQARKR